MERFIYKQMVAGIIRSVRLRKIRGDKPHEIVAFLVGLTKKINDPRLQLFLLFLAWMESEGTKEAV